VHGDDAPGDARLVRLITLDAARALGFGDRIGRLAPGALADILVLRTAEGTAPDDPYAAALHNASRVDLVMVAGEELVVAGRPTRVDAGHIAAGADAIASRLR